ncbi:MAG: hypothetical protein AAGG01_05695, partial [Planctomycetota bacterium]
MLNLKLELQRGSSKKEVDLQPGLTRIGPKGSRGIDIGIEGAEGELHVWDSPPKVVRVQGEDALIVGGDPVEEALLEDGSEFAWCGFKFRLRELAPVLEEIAEPVVAPGAAAPDGAHSRGGAGNEQAW